VLKNHIINVTFNWHSIKDMLRTVWELLTGPYSIFPSSEKEEKKLSRATADWSVPLIWIRL